MDKPAQLFFPFLTLKFQKWQNGHFFFLWDENGMVSSSGDAYGYIQLYTHTETPPKWRRKNKKPEILLHLIVEEKIKPLLNCSLCGAKFDINVSLGPCGSEEVH